MTHRTSAVWYRSSKLIGVVAALGVLATVAAQIAVVRRRVPQLPAPTGAARGKISARGNTMRLLVIGESSAVGLGVLTRSEGLAARLAHDLSRSTGRDVHWRAVGRIGARVRTVNRELAAAMLAQPADIAVIALGVNDTLRLTTPRHWYRQLGLLVGRLRQHGCKLVVISPVPPLWKFRCLPQPLRAIAGVQAFALDRTSRLLATHLPNDTIYVPVPFDDQDRLLCSDRFHPSAAGYRVWAAHLAHAIAARLESCSPCNLGIAPFTR